MLLYVLVVISLDKCYLTSEETDRERLSVLFKVTQILAQMGSEPGSVQLEIP